MSRDDILAAAERMTEAVNGGELDVLDDLLANDIVDHDASPHAEPGEGGYKQFIEDLRSAFPDLTITPDHVDATDEDVAVIYTISGTHRGKFLGVAPTGRHISVRGMQVIRFEDGKIVERWGSADELGLLRQLDADWRP